MDHVTSCDHIMMSCDFSVWRKEELDRINSTTSGAERKAALCALLEQEAELIAGIGQHRMEAGREAKDRTVNKFLEAVSGSKVVTVAYGNSLALPPSPYR